MYHVSKVSGITKLEPRVPSVPCEPDVPRVCAAPTVHQCVLALVDLEPNVDYFVYHIEAEPDVNNQDVISWPAAPEEWLRWGDAEITGEVWYLHPVKCTLFGTMDWWGEVTEV